MVNEGEMKFEAIVIGVSAGGLKALRTILLGLPKGFTMPVIIVQHLSANSDGDWIEILDGMSHIRIKEAEEKEEIRPGVAYIAPPGYHLLIEEDRTFSLSAEDRVNFSRPSIDVLFESAADVYGKSLIGIILTGLNYDGAAGLKEIKNRGGLAIVEDPDTAEWASMPESAIEATEVDYVVSLEEIVPLLIKLQEQKN